MTALSRPFVRGLAALALVAAMGCGANPTQVAADPRIAGKWSRLDGLYPFRFSEVWNLSMSGTAISGSGGWYGEACCAGTLSITGSFDADSVHLVVDLVTTGGPTPPPRRYRFDGTLVAPDSMVGIGTASDSTRWNEQLQKWH